MFSLVNVLGLPPRNGTSPEHPIPGIPETLLAVIRPDAPRCHRLHMVIRAVRSPATRPMVVFVV